ncbi:MAG: hypothetical protein ND895_19340 [Pyrinomonadaceae bacterium]|nr:hypothetical protein [Pyrinomonadaceae bacterium]
MRIEPKHILILILILVAVLLLYPRENTVAPAFRLRVFDEAGNPASRVVVKQEWEYLAVGSEQQSEYSSTDENGYVEFPRRSERVSLLRKGLSVLRELAHLMHGYGIGPRAQVWAYGEDPHVWTFVSCEVGRSAPQELRLKRWDTAMGP